MTHQPISPAALQGRVGVGTVAPPSSPGLANPWNLRFHTYFFVAQNIPTSQKPYVHVFGFKIELAQISYFDFKSMILRAEIIKLYFCYDNSLYNIYFVGLFNHILSAFSGIQPRIMLDQIAIEVVRAVLPCSFPF